MEPITPVLRPLNATGIEAPSRSLPSAAGHADADANLRFEQALQGTSPEADAAAATTVSEGPPPISGPRTLGDTILGGLKHLSRELQGTWTSVDHALNGAGPVPSVREMLTLQMGLSKMTFEYELVSKAVSRSTQNIDQLVKLQ